MNIFSLNTDKIFEFIADEYCENCGTFSKTALCATCHDELISQIHDSSEQDVQGNGEDTKPS